MPDLDRLLHDVVEASLSPVDVGAIVARRRRRRRVRRIALATGAAAVVVAAGAVAIAGSRSATRRPVAAVHVSPRDPAAAQAATDSALAHSLLMAGGGGSGALGEALSSLTVVDPVTGATHEVPLPLPPAQSSVYPYVVRGSSFVVVLDSQTGATDPAIGAAYAVPSTLRAAVPIGRASYAFAALDPDRVWLATDDATPQQRIDGTEYGPHRGVEEVDLTGHAVTPVDALTADRSPVAEVAGGLLTSRPDPVKTNPPIIEVWDPAHDRVVRRLPAADVVVAGGSWVAYTQPDCSTACAMHVVDVRTGVDRAYAPPAGTEWDGEGESLFSPDGTQLALVARAPDRDPHFGSSGRSTARAIVSTITTATGARHDRSVTISADRVALAWSPDSAVVFFTLDQGHVGYFPVPDTATPLRTLAIAGAPDFFVVGHTPPPPAPAPTPAPGATQPRYQIDARVEQDRTHGPELCIYAVRSDTANGTDCGGPRVTNWNWNTAPDPQRASGTTFGRYRLVGTYDGTAFTLTQPPVTAPAERPMDVSRPAPCAAPAGGWHSTGNRHALADFSALQDAANHAADFAGIWVSSTVGSGPAVDFQHNFVTVVAFTGDLDAHRRALAAVWSGPLCVVARPHSSAQLADVANRINAPGTDTQLGIQIMSDGTDDVRDAVALTVVAATPATQRALDARFGAGVVVVSSLMKPVP